MALDLFFVARKLDFSAAQAPGFEASDAQLRARRKLLKAIAERFGGAAIGGKASDGAIAGFPLGELHAYPGYLHWSLHDASAREPIEAVVDWFHEQGLVCEDPQNLGFGNRQDAAARENLADWDALVGARLVSIELSIPGITGLLLTWMLSDGREAKLRLIHHERCEVPPNLTALIRDRIARVGFTSSQASDDFRFVFESGAEIRCVGAVPTQFFAQVAPKSGW